MRARVTAERAPSQNLLTRISIAWRNRCFDDLARCFDEHIVMASPGFSESIQGRDRLVDSYREFMDRATLISYEKRPPDIKLFGDTAIASYHWGMSWLDGGTAHHAAGTDVFVCSCNRDVPDASWRAVWRTMSVETDGN